MINGDVNPFAAAGEEFRRHELLVESARATSIVRKPPPARPPPAAPSALVLDSPSSTTANESAPSAKVVSDMLSAAGQGYSGLKLTTSAPEWAADKDYPACACCLRKFDQLWRRHHCRGCGIIFCSNCTPPPRLMLPAGFGKKEPQRCCLSCAVQLREMQQHLIETNSNSVRVNGIATGGLRRYFNRPVSFTLGGEIRKAAHSLNNMMDGLELAVEAVDEKLRPSTQDGFLKAARGILFLTIGKVLLHKKLKICVRE